MFLFNKASDVEKAKKTLIENAVVSNWAQEIGMDKVPKVELREIYDRLSERRLQWDNLLWQVPLISLTGVSFLFTIIFLESTSRFSRTMVCLLTILISYASLFTLARHRASEVYDSNLMQGIEEILYGRVIHGKDYSTQRKLFVANKRTGLRKDSKSIWDNLIVRLNVTKSYPIWMFVFVIFMTTSLVCLVLNLFHPQLFRSS
jgi:cell division protein FtsL